jgi:anti-sigma regulatory factor (Ser/Thr protein kinase)
MDRSVNPTNSLSLTSDSRDVELLHDRLDSLLEKTGLDEMAAFGFRCAAIEVVNNSIQHAYLDQAGHPIKITFRLEPSMLELVVFDRGPVYSGPAESTRSDPLAESGRGFEIIKAGVSKLEYSHSNGWNKCRLSIQIP